MPQTLVLDNLRAAVSKADWFDPELNPKAQSFFAHYNVVPLPTKPRTPRHKGKVERGVAYVQDNALKGHTFASIAEQNAHLRHWEEHVADTRTTARRGGSSCVSQTSIVIGQSPWIISRKSPRPGPRISRRLPSRGCRA